MDKIKKRFSRVFYRILPLLESFPEMKARISWMGRQREEKGDGGGDKQKEGEAEGETDE